MNNEQAAEILLGMWPTTLPYLSTATAYWSLSLPASLRHSSCSSSEGDHDRWYTWNPLTTLETSYSSIFSSGKTSGSCGMHGHRSCHSGTRTPSALMRVRVRKTLYYVIDIDQFHAPNAKLKIRQYIILPDYRQNRQNFCTPIFLRLRWLPHHNPVYSLTMQYICM